MALRPHTRAADLTGYLARLGFDGAALPPTYDTLAALHRAHVERIAYECIDHHVPRATPLAAPDSVARLAAGRGGYCFHLNGAFSELLGHLGFAVTRHRAAVRHAADGPLEPDHHLALTVVADGLLYLADVGLGDGIHEPLPLRPGSYPQGPYTYTIGRTGTGWRFTHDPRGSFRMFEFDTAPAWLPEDFADVHAWFATSPESGFVRTLTAQRRDAGGTDVLRGCVLRRTDAAGETAREIDTAEEWYATLTGLFGLNLGDLDAPTRDRLWAKTRRAHRDWQASRDGREPGLPATDPVRGRP
ncbi:arylamine N-acetyltransferase [Actinocatenispora thailandica]|uniref:Arylamine N-acetyltransferase n=1 Tax=Actinocatenispora thailandica TaxID=227318 RepID=A0A7R7HY18_9ACTN|nr:arylamine N-acetyltransferase [Actinocatenispora thailandica]BCJ36633.1 arylamine N-acetyltransferase [Actinocatenispora thailandica]